MNGEEAIMMLHIYKSFTQKEDTRAGIIIAYTRSVIMSHILDRYLLHITLIQSVILLEYIEFNSILQIIDGPISRNVQIQPRIKRKTFPKILSTVCAKKILCNENRFVHKQGFLQQMN